MRAIGWKDQRRETKISHIKRREDGHVSRVMMKYTITGKMPVGGPKLK